VKAIRAAGGTVYCTEPSKTFLRRWLPQDYFDDVDQVLLGDATDDTLAHLEPLSILKFLELHHARITDAGLVHLQGLTGLRRLDLSTTHVTDAGLAHLQEPVEISRRALA
jgi:hypothetical protein